MRALRRAAAALPVSSRRSHLSRRRVRASEPTLPGSRRPPRGGAASRSSFPAFPGLRSGAARALAGAFVPLALGVLAAPPDAHGHEKHGFYLECPTTEVEEGKTLGVYFVVRDHYEASWKGFRGYFYTDSGTAGTDDYVEQKNTATPVYSTNKSDLDKDGLQRGYWTVKTKSDDVLESDETFTLRFDTERSTVVDANDPDLDEKCEITIKDATPGVRVSESTLAMDEGGSDTYTVRLVNKPSGNVKVTTTSSNPSAATVSPASLTFTSSNWDTPQEVTVGGLTTISSVPTAARPSGTGCRATVR